VLEPTGEGKITVEFSDDLLDAYGKDPYSLQYIVDAAKPIMDGYATKIAQLGKEIQVDIDNAKKKEKDEKASGKVAEYGNSAVLKENLQRRNKHYKDFLQQAKKEAEAAMQDQWVKLVETSQDLKKFQIKIGTTVAKGVFQIAKGVVAAVATGGSDITAYAGIIQGVIAIYGAVSDALKTEDEARKALKTAIKQAEDSLDKFNKEKKSAAQLFADWYSGKNQKGEKLREKIDIFYPKLIKSRLQAQELAKTLQKMLTGKGLSEKAIAAQIDSIAKLGEIVTSGEALIGQAKGLISALEGTRTNKTSPEKLSEAMQSGQDALTKYDAHVKKAESALSTGKKLLQAFVDSVK